MSARMRNPLAVVPEALKALKALSSAGQVEGLGPTITGLAYVRASQINGCSVCAAIHARELRSAGESDERLFTISAWRDAKWFTDAERAALALAEAVTRLADRTDPVNDEIWNEARRHFDETALAGLVFQIAAINAYSQLHCAVRQPVGAEELALIDSAACARGQG